jgi:hypothetical protein
MPDKRTSGIKDFKIATTAYTTLHEITTNEDGNPLYDSGDVDNTETMVGQGVSRCSFSVVVADPVQAQAIKTAAAAAWTWNGVDLANAANVLVTMANAKVFGRSGRTMHNGVWMITMSGRCDSITYAAAP